MDEEIQRHGRELERAMSKKDGPKVLESLRTLDAIPMTLDVLQSTHIGAIVNKARKMENTDISMLARKLVKRWKGQITSQQADKADKIDKSEKPEKIEKPEKPAAVATAPGPTQSEVPQTACSVRLTIRKQLTEALKIPLPKELANEPFLEEEVLACRIEDCIYQEFKGNTDMKYRNRCRSRVSNLRDAKNPYLRYNVLRGDIGPERMAKMTAEEMASDELKKEREKFTKEAINDHQMSLTTGTTSSDIKCTACKKYNVTYNQVQTRSADEPMTTFCYCNDCGKRWKFC